MKMKSSNQNYSIAPVLKFVLLIALALSGCGGTEGSSEGEISGEEPISSVTQKAALDGNGVAMLVLCDLTSHLDRNSMEHISEMAGEIVQIVPEGSKVNFYPIGDGPFQSTLMEFKKRVVSRATDRVLLKNETLDASQEVKKSLMELYDETNKDFPEDYPRSCIWSLIEAKLKFLEKNRVSEEGERCQYIVILSDMIEQCNDGPIGRMSLTRRGYNTKKKEEVDTYISQNQGKLKGIHVACVVAPRSGPRKEKKYLTDTEVKSFWEKFYSGLGADEVMVGPDLPDDIGNDCLNN